MESKNRDKKKHIVAISALVKNKKGDRVLVIKRSKNEIAYPGKWAFPGGKVEPGERIIDTLKREVMEEAGLEIEDDKQFITDYTFVRPDGHNVVGFSFLVKAKSHNVKISKDFDDYKWISPEELINLDHIKGMEEEVREAFTK